jgi:fucose permease
MVLLVLLHGEFSIVAKSSLLLILLQIGFAALELVTSLHAFWKADGAAFREAHPRTSDAAGSRLKEACLSLPAARVTWLCALFFLGYVGVEVALGGWIVEFMIRVRDANPFSSGMSATGFWLGITVGRVILGFVTPRIGEKLSLMVSCYHEIKKATR